MAHHKNHFTATILSLCTYALTSGLLTCDYQHRNDIIHNLIHTMASKNLQSSHVKSLRSPLSFVLC